MASSSTEGGGSMRGITGRLLVGGAWRRPSGHDHAQGARHDPAGDRQLARHLAVRLDEHFLAFFDCDDLGCFGAEVLDLRVLDVRVDERGGPVPDCAQERLVLAVSYTHLTLPTI